MSDIKYLCPVCHREETAVQGQPVPLCCGREMEPLPFCTTMADPELARNYRDDEPCDDSTSSSKPDRKSS